MQFNSDADGHFQNYSEYSKTLRSWLVAYGIGAPVLFLTNKDVSARVASSGHAVMITSFFLVGVALQIFLSVINKWAAWHMYKGAVDGPHRVTKQFAFWGWINEQSWIDFLIDLTSLFAFVVATWSVLQIFLSTVTTTS